MDIRFTVGDTNYKLSSDKYQVFLNTVKISTGEKTMGEEKFDLIGCYANEFQALTALVDKTIYGFPAKTFDELAAYRLKTLEQINEVVRKYSIGR